MSNPVCPFPGLLPFQEEDAPFFFGRDEETAELLQRLERNRFVAVIGVSGSGKSSLVHAGLKPELRLTEPAWRLVECKPGGGPRQRLQGALQSVMSGVKWSELLGKSSYGLVDGIAAAGLGPDDKLLITVDQFEEIFSYRRLGDREAAEADLFVQQLLRAVAEPGLSAYVMLTMRTDYLGHCALFRGLPEVLNRGTYLVPRLTRHEQKEAITAPLAVSGVGIEPSLVDQLLNSAEANRSELPVLQHLLKRLWEEWVAGGGSGIIDTAELEKTGSWNTAIDLDAESVFETLNLREQEAIKGVFQRITEKGAAERPIRTPTLFDELCRLTSRWATPEELGQILKRFESRDLLTLPADELVDIPHECVTWRWTRLAGWIEEENLDARRLTFIAESARTGTPLAGSALIEAIALLPRISSSWVDRYGLATSELAQWIDHSRREATRARRRTRTAMLGLTAGMALLAALGLWALQQRRAALTEKAVAEKANLDLSVQTARVIQAQVERDERDSRAMFAEADATIAKRQAEIRKRYLDQITQNSGGGDTAVPREVQRSLAALENRSALLESLKVAFLASPGQDLLESRWVYDYSCTLFFESDKDRDSRLNAISVALAIPALRDGHYSVANPRTPIELRVHFETPFKNSPFLKNGLNLKREDYERLARHAVGAAIPSDAPDSYRRIVLNDQVWGKMSQLGPQSFRSILPTRWSPVQVAVVETDYSAIVQIATSFASVGERLVALNASQPGEGLLKARRFLLQTVKKMTQAEFDVFGRDPWELLMFDEVTERRADISARANQGALQALRRSSVPTGGSVLPSPTGEIPGAGRGSGDPLVPVSVRRIIVEQLGVDEQEVRWEARFRDDLGADDLDIVELVMAIEEAFKIEIPDEDFERQTRVRDVVEYLRKRKVLK